MVSSKNLFFVYYNKMFICLSCKLRYAYICDNFFVYSLVCVSLKYEIVTIINRTVSCNVPTILKYNHITDMTYIAEELIVIISHDTCNLSKWA